LTDRGELLLGGLVQRPAGQESRELHQALVSLCAGLTAAQVRQRLLPRASAACPFHQFGEGLVAEVGRGLVTHSRGRPFSSQPLALRYRVNAWRRRPSRVRTSARVSWSAAAVPSCERPSTKRICASSRSPTARFSRKPPTATRTSARMACSSGSTASEASWVTSGVSCRETHSRDSFPEARSSETATDRAMVMRYGPKGRNPS